MTTKTFLSYTRATLASFSALIVAASIQPSFAQDIPATPRERIGVYDSRAVAVAFAGSPEHQRQIQALKTEHQKAKEAGDLDKVAKLEAEGKAGQQQLHKQGFSTAPVDDLLKHITNALPKIRTSAGVSHILSKWDKAALKKHSGAETVDITMQLVDAFQPNERQRKSALEIQKHKPISIEQAEKISD